MSKGLSKLDVIALVIGAVIGWGSFYLPGNKFLPEAGVLNTAIGFLVGGVLIYAIQVGYHTMMFQHQEQGGEFSYTLVHLGKKHGFVVGWALSFCYLTLISLNATAVVLVLKEVLGSVSYGYLYTIAGYPVYLSEIGIGMGIIYLFYWINKRGLVLSMTFQKILIISLVATVFLLSMWMFYRSDRQQFYHQYIASYHFDFAAIIRVVAIIPFLFVGFDIVPQVMTDLGFSIKVATKVTLLATTVGVLIYNLLNLMTAFAYSPDQAKTLAWASGSAVLTHAGWLGFGALCIALFAAVVGGINGFLIASSRVVASLALYELLPGRYQQTNQYQVAENALKFVSLIAAVLLFLGREVILYIVDLSSLMAAVTYAYVCFISAGLAKRLVDRRLSQLGVVISFFFIGLLLVPGSPSQLGSISMGILVGWILLGLLYFKVTGNRK
ncbi:APC family permease [Streptococcus sp. ZJ93]|uniref:APC family permease n=1 Tax=Streptococcus handemini TaxID=3161188 RepID=UPI0032EAD8AB